MTGINFFIISLFQFFIISLFHYFTISFFHYFIISFFHFFIFSFFHYFIISFFHFFMKSKEFWKFAIQVAISVLTAIATALGATSCVASIGSL